MSSTNPENSVAALVDDVGGVKFAAAYADVTELWVKRWIVKGYIPNGTVAMRLIEQVERNPAKAWARLKTVTAAPANGNGGGNGGSKISDARGGAAPIRSTSGWIAPVTPIGASARLAA